MKQLSLNITDDSIVKIVASSSFDYRIEIIEKIGKSDVEQIIDISKERSIDVMVTRLRKKI